MIILTANWSNDSYARFVFSYLTSNFRNRLNQEWTTSTIHIPDVVLSGIHNPHKSLFHRNHIPQGIPTYEGHFHPSVVLADLLYSVRLLSAEPRSGDLRPAKQKTSRLSWSLLHSLQGICLFAFEEIIRHFLLADTLSLSFVLRENGGPAYP